VLLLLLLMLLECYWHEWSWPAWSPGLLLLLLLPCLCGPWLHLEVASSL
jgi:hypothetical protein